MRSLIKKLKNYKVWVAIIGAGLMLAQALGMKVEVPILKEALLASCAVLVTLGILTNPDNGEQEAGGMESGSEDKTSSEPK